MYRMVNPPCLRSAIPATNPPDLQVLQDRLSIRSAYLLELITRQKVATFQWLISATSLILNHLRTRTEPFIAETPQNIRPADAVRPTQTEARRIVY